MLPKGGPLGTSSETSVKTIQLGLVCLPGEEFAVRRWFDSIHKPLLNDESNARRFREFPGVEKAFRCRFEIPDHFVVRLNQPQYALALTRAPAKRFESLLKLYGDAIKSLFGDSHPACVLVCFSEDVADLRITNPRLSYEERTLLEELQREDEAEQMSLFEPTEDQKRLAANSCRRLKSCYSAISTAR